MSVPPAWSTQQLAEFLAAISAVEEHDAAGRIAVERAAEALDAEVAALLSGDRVDAVIGFGGDEAAFRELSAVTRGESDQIEVAGAGACQAVAAPLDGGWLVIARLGDERFSRDEVVLARSMARVLALSLRALAMLEKERALREESDRQAAENASLLASLRRRQVLLERLSEVQRAIVRRVDREQVLETIVADIAELTGEDLAYLGLVDPEDPETLVIAAHRGIDDRVFARVHRRPVRTGISGLCVREGRVVMTNDYATHESHNSVSAGSGVRAAIAAPVRQQGEVVGALVLGSRDGEREYGSEEREVLEAFAENASIALTDAAMVDAAFRQAYHDSLTGLANRTALLERLDHALARSERSGAPCAILFLDLDGFKGVNDSLGHAVGDELLRAAAERLSACVRPGDTAARLGGDEFAVLLEGLAEDDEAERVAARVLEELRAPFVIHETQLAISASIGIATGTRRSDDLLRNADLAMYGAKGGGRDRVVTFEEGMRSALLDRLELERDMRRAIQRGEFVLHYQPIVDLASADVTAIEALVRWQHPRRGMLLPGDFIPLAEETRMIVPIGRHVLREACRQAAGWRGRHGDVTVTVNLSAAQLEDPALVDEVDAALRESGLLPSLLLLEITETVLMSDRTEAIGKLAELKRLGVRLAVDDFGTGYSSLQYLRDLPLDVLKVAKTFVDALDDGADGDALTRAIVDLGESCMLDVVGEGIELEAQRARLIELGCQLGQGFLFARPAPAADVDALLGERRAPGAADVELLDRLPKH